jgi:hypothetical protein
MHAAARASRHHATGGRGGALGQQLSELLRAGAASARCATAAAGAVSPRTFARHCR